MEIVRQSPESLKVNSNSLKVNSNSAELHILHDDCDEQSTGGSESTGNSAIKYDTFVTENPTVAQQGFELESGLAKQSDVCANWMTMTDHFTIWEKTHKPRVNRNHNGILTFFVVLSMFSYLTVLVAAAANISLNIFFAIYGALLYMPRTQAYFFSIAAFWLACKFAKVFLMLFHDLWDITSLAWGSKYDERFEDILWDQMLTDGKWEKISRNFQDWWKEIVWTNRGTYICCCKLNRGDVFRLNYSFLVILTMPVVYAFGHYIDPDLPWPTAIHQSYCVALLLVAFACLTVNWFYRYYILIMVIKTQIITVHHITNGRSYYAAQKYLLWFFWDNPYLSGEFLRLSPFWRKLVKLALDLVISPFFIGNVHDQRH